MTDPRSILVDPEAELTENANTDEGAGSPDSVNDNDTTAQTQPAEEESNLPEKLRGKSIEEIADMYVNAEKALGSKNDELGRWRELALERQALGETTSDVDDDEDEDVELTADALIDDPNGSIRAVIRRELKEALAPVTEDVELTRAERAIEQFEERHGDAAQIAQSPEFSAWAQRSPYRTQLAARAGKGDLAAADQLLTEFKADNPAPSAPAPAKEVTPTPTEQEQAVAQAKAVSTESGQGGGAPTQPKRTFSQAEITKMINTDFAAYSDPAFQRELAEAIKEGRVSGL